MNRLTICALVLLLAGCETPSTWVEDQGQSQVQRDFAECRYAARGQAIGSPATFGLAAPASPYGLNPAVVATVAAMQGATNDCMIARGYRLQAR